MKVGLGLVLVLGRVLVWLRMATLISFPRKCGRGEGVRPTSIPNPSLPFLLVLVGENVIKLYRLFSAHAFFSSSFLYRSFQVVFLSH